MRGCLVLGQSLLSDFFIIPMGLEGGLISKPIAFENFIKDQQLQNNLYTEKIPTEELNKLQDLLPTVITFAHKLYMDQEQQKLQSEMENKLAMYQEKMKNWKESKYDQLDMVFGDQTSTRIVKQRRNNQEIEIKTILDKSSQYFKDLTSLSGNPHLKLIAVFYNN